MATKQGRHDRITKMKLESLSPQPEGFSVMASNVFDAFHGQGAAGLRADVIEQLHSGGQVTAWKNIFASKPVPEAISGGHVPDTMSYVTHSRFVRSAWC